MKRVNVKLGFSLLEVLVALAIVAVSLAALSRSGAQIVETQVRIERQQIASLCADNAFAELRLTEPFPAPGERQIECTQLGQRLRARMSILPTPNPNFRRIQTIWRDSDDTILITLTAIAASNTGAGQ
jgi:general secretion pathway protein I